MAGRGRGAAYPPAGRGGRRENPAGEGVRGRTERAKQRIHWPVCPGHPLPLLGGQRREPGNGCIPGTHRTGACRERVGGRRFRQHGGAYSPLLYRGCTGRGADPRIIGYADHRGRSGIYDDWQGRPGKWRNGRGQREPPSLQV